jgi:hypothetical protein
MRRRQLKWLWARLAQLQDMQLNRDELLMKLGSARSKVPAAWRLVRVRVSEGGEFTYWLDRKRLKQVRRREGRYLLRTNLTETDPVKLWHHYLQLVQVEEACPNVHQDAERIEAHVLIAFLAYCLYVTVGRRLKSLAPGLTARSALEKFATVRLSLCMCPPPTGAKCSSRAIPNPSPNSRCCSSVCSSRCPPGHHRKSSRLKPPTHTLCSADLCQSLPATSSTYLSPTREAAKIG